MLNSYAKWLNLTETIFVRKPCLQQLLISPTSEIVVAEIDNEVVGSGYGIIREADSFLEHSHFIYLGFMCVKPTQRGKGINRAILEKLEE